jgi:acylphosphatase
MRIVRLTIHGRVQGVGFRAFVEDEAYARRLAGWVRNRRDGTVEAVVAGEERLVEEMVAACRQGPAAADVERVDVEDADATALAARGPGASFAVLPTA